jgi:protein-S-isoprenylcysteine O-methyltransferase
MIVFQPHLLVISYLALYGLFCVGEVTLAIRRRATDGVVPEDRGFLSRAFVIFILSNLLAVPCLRLFPAASYGTYFTSGLGLGMMLVGLLLRWWSIVHLGRLFTVNVAVAIDHRVVDDGPYTLIRHPSYTGVLLLIGGVALCFGNFSSDLVLIAPYATLVMTRMRIEEAAMARELGESYRAYMKRTKRLIPGIY